MKELKVHFTDAEFRKIKKAKLRFSVGMSWHNFIINNCSRGISVRKDLKGGKKDGRETNK